jgi:predicted DNA-binding transcriptional regulator YafY
MRANHSQLKTQILTYLTESKSQITASGLSRQFKVGSKSIVRRMIKEMRKEGHPICSNADGYYYSEKEEDIQATVDMLQRMSNGIETTITSLRNAGTVCRARNYRRSRNPCEGQMGLFN